MPRTASTSLATGPVAPNACSISPTAPILRGGGRATKPPDAVGDERAGEDVVERLPIAPERDDEEAEAEREERDDPGGGTEERPAVPDRRPVSPVEEPQP